MESELQAYLREWIFTYAVAHSIYLFFGGCDPDIFGRCVQVPAGNPRGGPYSEIYLNDLLLDHPFAARATLWHEFCHAYFWLNEGRLVGHGPDWLKMFWSKPALAFYETLVTPILWLFIRKRR